MPQTEYIDRLIESLRNDAGTLINGYSDEYPGMTHIASNIEEAADQLTSLQTDLAVAQRALLELADNHAELCHECRCPLTEGIATETEVLTGEQISEYGCGACESITASECWARWYTDRARKAVETERKEAGTRG